ncbi:hypothetical protein JW890_09495 [candidate division WOR-3 bacterium]|nr:hypothetical protein [candidate division WOR-3 bacterium]
MIKKILSLLLKKKTILIPTSLAICDVRFIPFLEIFHFRCYLQILSSWPDFFLNLADSSSSHKKEGKMAISNLERLSELVSVEVIKVSDCNTFSDLLKRNRNNPSAFVLSSETEADHLSMLYKIKNIGFDRISNTFADKYWPGKFVVVKPHEKDESGLTGKLPDGTIYHVKDEEYIPEREITCRISSYVKTSEGTTLFLKRDKIAKKKLLWDLVQ